MKLSSFGFTWGNQTEKEEKMHAATTKFSKELYTCDNGATHTNLLELLPNKVSGDINETLCHEFTKKENKRRTLFGPPKAPRPDGFPSIFQRNWEHLKDEVVMAVKRLLKDGHMSERVNNTNITLIQKAQL